jgi:hypothetical protein
MSNPNEMPRPTICEACDKWTEADGLVWSLYEGRWLCHACDVWHDKPADEPAEMESCAS